jgi:hypothetical protein
MIPRSKNRKKDQHASTALEDANNKIYYIKKKFPFLNPNFQIEKIGEIGVVN